MIDYRTITTIKHTDKSSVLLVLMEGYEDPVVIKRLQNAAPEVYRMLSEVNSVHIPRIYAWEQQGEELVVAEEYVDGETLKFHLEQGTLTEEQKLSIARQLCEAVEVLHSCAPPIIHRDIKPSNILITENGIVKLIDFDASRRYKNFSEDSDTRVLGTPEYAAPEQYGYRQTDVRSDIYSIGMVLEGLSFHGKGLATVFWKRMLDVCTSFDPKKRYPGVKVLKKRISRVATFHQYARLYFCCILCMMLLLGIGGFLWNRSAQETEYPAVGGALTGTPEPTLTPTSTPEPTLPPTSTPEPTAPPISTPEPTLFSTSIPQSTQEKLILVADALDGTSRYVDEYYQSADRKIDYRFYSSYFETASDITSATMTDLVSGKVLELSGDDCWLEHSMIHLDADFMHSLQSTHYQLHFELTAQGKWKDIVFETQVRIHSPEEIFVDGGTALQGNCLDYCYKEHDKLHIVLRPDTNANIIGLNYGMVEQVPEEQYCILYDGRAMELSAELLEQCKNQAKTIFYVVLDNGSQERLTIVNPYR